jgi:signal peptidase II
MRNRFLLMALICLPCVGCDQLTKFQATHHLMGKPGLSFWGDVFRLEYALNPGAWGGLGSQLPDPIRKGVFTVGVGIMLVALGWYILRQAESRLSTIALSFILAGGIGNLIDRALHGHVVDFLYLGLPGSSWLHTNIFNLADVFVMLGAALWAIALFKMTPSAPVSQNVLE